MAKKGIFRRIAERITSPFKKAAPTARPTPKRTSTAARPSRPSPAVAREQLFVKFQDMYWLQKKWDAAATSKRISKMTDAQVYAVLDMSENDIETAVRTKPKTTPEWASPDDPNSNMLWYHGGETMVA